MTSKFFRQATDGTLIFWCPGCREHHGVDKRWVVSGTPEKPTIRPSIHHPGRCHLFITEGAIEYLGDCTHSLRVQTVPMVEPT